MSGNDAFIKGALADYERASAAAMRWMLARPRLHGVFLNTKFNPLTLADYGDADGWRGPGYLYGWIQGRGLEALAHHAAFFESRDGALALALDEAGRALYAALSRLRQNHNGAFFLYDEALRPVRRGEAGAALPQSLLPGLKTFSDAFFLKGLAAAAHRYEPAAAPGYAGELAGIAAAIEDQRFVTNEQQQLGRKALAEQLPEYGPRMIMLGAAAMLRGMGFENDAGFGGAFIEHILRHHARETPHGLIIADTPGGDAVNPGHAIEFAGFAFEYLGRNGDPSLLAVITRVLLSAFKFGHADGGVRLALSAGSGAALNAMRPWWPLPEAIRACARGYAVTGDARLLETWQRAHASFFGNYWLGDPPVAVQTRDAAGPVDFVPATPDLDPGYHTGLSLLSAINAMRENAET